MWSIKGKLRQVLMLAVPHQELWKRRQFAWWWMNLFSKYGNVSVTIHLLMGELSLWGLKVVGPEQLASINSCAGKAETVQYFFLFWLDVFSAFPIFRARGSVGDGLWLVTVERFQISSSWLCCFCGTFSECYNLLAFKNTNANQARNDYNTKITERKFLTLFESI